jgi:hypothetical protein
MPELKETIPPPEAGDSAMAKISLIDETGEEIGRLVYYPYIYPIYFDDISIKPEKQEPGFGLLLLKKFVENVGDNRAVQGSFSNLEMRERMEQEGYYSGSTIYIREITDPEILNSYPIIRLFTIAGITVDKVSFLYDEEYDEIDILYDATTHFL